jgi:hypothetical protein
MNRDGLWAVTVGAMLMVGAGAAGAADQGTVKSLSDLDSGAQHYNYIYPHTGAVPTDAYTTIPPVSPAPNRVAQPPQADTPLDSLAARHGGNGETNPTAPRPQ